MVIKKKKSKSVIAICKNRGRKLKELRSEIDWKREANMIGLKQSLYAEEQSI